MKLTTSSITWGLGNLIVFYIGFFIQQYNACLSSLDRLQYSVYFSRGAGLVLAMCMPLVILPMCKHTITFLRKSSKFIRSNFPDNCLLIHRYAGTSIAIFTIVHTVSHYVNFYTAQKLGINTTIRIHYDTYAGISGHIMLMSLFTLLIYSGRYFRTYLYDKFNFYHKFYWVMFFAFLFHGVGCFVKMNNGKCAPYYSDAYFVPVLLIFLIERMYRWTRKPVFINKTVFFDDACAIYFTKNTLRYLPGQYLLINYPQIDKTYHPFTITSCPESEDHISVVIRGLGDWTKKFKEIQSNLDQVTNQNWINIDGPFSSPCDRVNDFDDLIFVATGIGITPFISIMKNYTFNYEKSEGVVEKRITLIWINRENENFDWFDEELKEISESVPENYLGINVYLTESFFEPSLVKEISYGEQPNYIQGTKIPLNYGRPNFDYLFRSYLNSGLSGNVGVFTCANNSVNSCLKDICRDYTNRQTKFTLVSEIF